MKPWRRWLIIDFNQNQAMKKLYGGLSFALLLRCLCSPLASQADPVIDWGNNAYVRTNILQGVTNVIALAAGDQHYLALKADGTVASWGVNSSGQTNVPPGLTNVVSIAAGSAHSLALRRDGTLAFWGQILAGSGTAVPDDATNIVAVASGSGAQHALVLRSDGSVLDWGGNKSYGLTNIPATARDVVAVAAGANYCLALRADGRVVAWGYHVTSVPAAATDIVEIATGWYGNAALRADGTVLVWGSISTPTAAFTNVVDVACPFSSQLGGNCAILAARNDGALAVTPGSVPAAATNVVAVAAGGYDAMALVGSGPPVFPGLPVNRTVADGSTAYLRMCAVGALPLFYQWNCNGTNIPGATSTILALTNVQPGQAGNYYTLTVSNAFGIATNGPIILNTIPLEFSIEPPGLSTVCGAAATFQTTNIVGQGPFSFQWQFNHTNIDGATDSSLSLASLQLNQAGTYSVVVGNGYGNVTNNAALAVQPFVFNVGAARPLMTTNGLKLQLDSVYSSNPVVLFASTNLVNWLPILTNPPTTGSVLFLDVAATNLPQRFYRATER
jgi:hypothetical protein